MSFKKFIFLALFFVQLSLYAEEVKQDDQAYIEVVDDQTIVHLKGNPYELGLQHGRLLKDQVAENVTDFVDGRLNDPKAKVRYSDFQKALPQVMGHIPESIIQELHGLADGSEIPFEKILMLNLFPEMFHCTAVTAAGKATEDGLLYHARVLDYGMGKKENLQKSAVLFVVEPTEGIPFLNVSYAGFVGSVTGMNQKKISVGEIGGLGYGFWDGVPMAFLIRQILEKSQSLEEAMDLLQNASRTCEYYYIISDGNKNKSVAVYATASQLCFITPGMPYGLMAPYNLPKNYGNDGRNDKFFVDNFVIDQSPFQTVVYRNGDKKNSDIIALFHKQPEECLTLTGFVNPQRYPILTERVMQNFGKINVEVMKKILQKPVTCETNLHNAIFVPANLEVWISHAGSNGEPASDQPYFHYQLSNQSNSEK